jgi:hypothetical protein
MCVGEAVIGYGFTRSTAWTTSGKSIADIIAAEPRVQAVLDEQRIGTLRPAGPVRVATGVYDDIEWPGHPQGTHRRGARSRSSGLRLAVPEAGDDGPAPTSTASGPGAHSQLAHSVRSGI